MRLSEFKKVLKEKRWERYLGRQGKLERRRWAGASRRGLLQDFNDPLYLLNGNELTQDPHKVRELAVGNRKRGSTTWAERSPGTDAFERDLNETTL